MKLTIDDPCELCGKDYARCRCSPSQSRIVRHPVDMILRDPKSSREFGPFAIVERHGNEEPVWQDRFGTYWFEGAALAECGYAVQNGRLVPLVKIYEGEGP